MTRDELVMVGMTAFKGKPIMFADSPDLTWLRVPMERVVDAVEPLIIDAEQADADRRVDRVILRNVERWTRLRAEVQRLHEEPYPHIFYGGEPTGWMVALNKVLTLMDGDNE